MSVFDPYARNQPPTPGLNTGSATQVSTLTPVETGPRNANRYRSGALGALAPFLGWCSVLLAVAMGFAALTATIMCQEYAMSVAVCSPDRSELVLVPIGVLVAGLVLAAIGGSLAKRRRAAPSLAVLVAGFVLLVVVAQWFSSSVLGLPFL